MSTIFVKTFIPNIYCHHRNLFSLSRKLTTKDGIAKVTSKFVEAGHIYFVATPIGNLKDISERAKEVLSSVDIVCCEDTRNTVELLRHLSLPHKQLISHHEHNWKTSTLNIISLIKQGNSIALVSDAGTPGISDPGAELAHALSLENIPIHPIPGASAVISALSISGFQCSDFSFMGFLAVKGKERTQKLQRMYNTEHTVIFYEAPHRVKETFRDLMKLNHNFNEVSPNSTMYSMSERQVVCCRELTKMHEEVKRGSVKEVLTWLETFKNKDDKKKGQNDKVIRGEFCIVLGPVGNEVGTGGETNYRTPCNEDSEDSDHTDIVVTDNDTNTATTSNTEATTNEVSTRPTILTLEQRVSSHLTQLRSDGLDRKDAVQLVVDMLGVARSVVYTIGMNMKWERSANSVVVSGGDEKVVKKGRRK